jgi:hypothetical protein
MKEWFRRQISFAKKVMERIARFSNSDVTPTLKKIQTHLNSYFPKLAATELNDLLTKACSLQRGINMEKTTRDEAMTALGAAFSPEAPTFERKTLLSVRAQAPEIANAWRALCGPHFPQDSSHALLDVDCTEEVSTLAALHGA